MLVRSRNRQQTQQNRRVAVKRPTPKPPEYNRWYWHPNRVGAYPLDDWRILRALKDVDPGNEISINWNPVTSRWQVWVRSPKFQHPLCQGWKLLFVVELDGEYAPVDERTLAKIYERSARAYGNLWEYWLKVEQAMDRERERNERSRAASTAEGAGDYYDYTQIKVGYGSSNGSKFARFHSGE